MSASTKIALVTGAATDIGRAVAIRLAKDGIVVMGIPIVDVTEADFDRINSVNYKGTYFVLQQAAKHVRNGGRFIQISSTRSLT